MATDCTKCLRWGILSAGDISHEFVNALKFHDGSKHKAVAVAARKLEKAQEFAKKFDIPTAYGTYKELAEDKDIDIVYVAVLNPYHYEVTKMCILAGQNVLCEKPMTMCKRDTETLVALAREKGVFLMEGFWTRFFPAYEQLREELTKDTIGDIIQVECSFGVPLSGKPRIYEKDLGGSILLDLGCYCIQAAQIIFRGEMPKRITARGSLFPSGVDSSANVILEYSGDRSAVITVNSKCYLDNSLNIYGTKGNLKVPSKFNCSETLITPDKKYEFPLPDTEIKVNNRSSIGFIYEQDAVRACLLKDEKESSLMSLDESITISAILDETIRQVAEA